MKHSKIFIMSIIIFISGFSIGYYLIKSHYDNSYKVANELIMKNKIKDKKVVNYYISQGRFKSAYSYINRKDYENDMLYGDQNAQIF